MTREAAEKAKIELSLTMQTETYLPFITGGTAGPMHITRSQLESLFDPLVKRTVEPCKKALNNDASEG